MGKGVGLVQHAKGRTKAIHAAIRNTQAIIAREIEQHDGLYPYNGGRLSEAEFCRRASISQITLLGEIHKKSTKVALNFWLKNITSQIHQGKRSIRKAVTQRVESWKQRHDQVANQYHLAELEMIGLRQRVSELEKISQEHEKTIKSLQSKLNRGSVVKFQR